MALLGVPLLVSEGEEAPPPNTWVDPNPVAITTTTTTVPVTTTTSTTTTTTTLPYVAPEDRPRTAIPLPPERLPTVPEITCQWIEGLERDRFITQKAVNLCLPVAQAFYDVRDMASERISLDKMGDWDQYGQDVLHGLYIMMAESGGTRDANSVNWGCPRDIRLQAPGLECDAWGNRVPLYYWSHMAHLVEDRSLRLLGYLIQPWDLYESSLLAAAMVYEVGGNGWYHWWHVQGYSYGGQINRLLESHGIRGVYHIPERSYWQNVRGGYQAPPWL